MTLRILCDRTADGTVVTVEGQLWRSETDELLRTCARIRGPVIVDLGGLTDTDSVGVMALRSLRQEGAQLVNPSMYLAMLLKEAS